MKTMATASRTRQGRFRGRTSPRSSSSSSELDRWLGSSLAPELTCAGKVACCRVACYVLSVACCICAPELICEGTHVASMPSVMCLFGCGVLYAVRRPPCVVSRNDCASGNSWRRSLSSMDMDVTQSARECSGERPSRPSNGTNGRWGI